MARTKAGTPPAYQLHKPSGRAKVVLPGDPNPIYLGKHGSPESHVEYAKALARWRLAQSKPGGLNVEPSEDLLVCELVVAYNGWARGYYVKNGRQTSSVSDIHAACEIVNQLFGGVRVKEFGPRKLTEVLSAFVDAGWSRKYCNKQLSVIKSMFKWGVSRELVSNETFGPLLAVSGIGKGRKADNGKMPAEYEPIGPVSDKVVNATIALLPQVLADMVRIERLTGARPEEICDMRPGDIDRSKPVWVYSPASYKTEHHEHLTRRRIPIGPKAQAILTPYLLRPPDAPCFSPREAYKQRLAGCKCHRRRKQLPNPRKTARVMRPAFDSASYRRAIKRAAVVAGVPEWHPNQLRHTRATELAEAYGIEAAQVTLGHTHFKTTEIYSEKSLAKACEVAAAAG